MMVTTYFQVPNFSILELGEPQQCLDYWWMVSHIFQLQSIYKWDVPQSPITIILVHSLFHNHLL